MKIRKPDQGMQVNFFLEPKLKDYSVMIDGRNFFQPIKVDVKTYENIRQIATGPVVDYKTYCLLSSKCQSQASELR